MNQSNSTKVLIMAGGRGTRMWPISNMAHPKQFESILGKESMFRETVSRVLSVYAPADIYVATSVHFREQIMAQAPELPPENFIFEPAMRDNLGALGLATAIIAKRHPGSVMLLLWGADHLIKKPAVFLAKLAEAAALARTHSVMVMVDAKPTYPSVHNGWIQLGEPVAELGRQDVFHFVRQVEKPNLSRAKEFFRSGKYMIHTGYLATRPELLLSHYAHYARETYSIIQAIVTHLDTPQFASVLSREYSRFPKTSVDNGLYEKLPRGTQWELPGEFGWVDVGTWELLYHGLDKDPEGNVVLGEAKLLATKNSLVIAKSKDKLGIIGLSEMIVVETEEGLLVCPLREAHQVKQLYQALYES